MMTDEGNRDDAFGGVALFRERNEHLNRAFMEYRDALSKLWLANGAGALSAISLLGAASRTEISLHRWFALCPAAFILGLICLLIGTVRTLLLEGRWLERNRDARGVLDMYAETIRPPYEDVMLRRSHPRTFFAVAAGALFFLGTALGGVAAYTALPA